MGELRRNGWKTLLAAAILLCWGRLLYGQGAAPSPDSVTVPMRVANNRVFIPIKVTGPSGKSRVVDFWVDSGGGILALSGRLAKQLGLAPGRGTLDGMGETPAQVVATPKLLLAGLPLNLNGTKAAAHMAPASKTVFAGIDAEGFLPAKILQQYDVVFDYPHRSFTLGKAGSLTHQGTAIPVSIQPKTGFAKIDLTIDSKVYGFMLDTGASFTGISKSLLSILHSEHPEWAYTMGAVGPANMVGKQFDVENAVMLLKNVSLGPFRIQTMGAVSRPAGVYENYISREMSDPIVGALAGNVLRQFRVELDYQNATAYLEQARVEQSSEVGCVGVILQIKDNGKVLLSGMSEGNDASTIPGFQRGDCLIKVNDRSVTGLSLATVLGTLTGNVGETRRLTLQRGRELWSVNANILDYPACREE